MSATLPTPASTAGSEPHGSSPTVNAMNTKPAPQPRQRGPSQRVLACHLCQKRKIKCDRCFPCANCTKKGVQCVPVAQPRQRRRRFPERKLLERLREVEGLLAKNNIKFEPLHGEPQAPDGDSSDSGDDSGNENDGPADPSSSTPGTVKSTDTQEAKSMWFAMGQKDLAFEEPGELRNNDDLQNFPAKQAWDSSFSNDDHMLLAGPMNSPIQLWELHPDPVDMFRLWQTYVDNVNPIMRLSHPPTLQVRIIEAAADVKAIDNPLHCLLFGIYSMAVLSMSDDSCQAAFGLPRDELLDRYQYASQQALRIGIFLRTNSRDCLTGYFLYLLSCRSKTHPYALWSMMSVALRIAQRMGMHNEGTNSRHNVLEAELRRRLWWAMAFVDARMTEFTEFKATCMNPAWDCKVPLNVNDSELHAYAETKEPLVAQNQAADSMFVACYSHIADYVRHSDFYLDFTNPMLKPLAKPRGDLDALERFLENTYLRFCDPNNCAHFMTLWSTRSFISKYRLVEHYAKYSDPAMDQTDEDRDAATLHARNVIDYDSKLMNSPMIDRYKWFLWTYFPMAAYIHLLIELRRDPVGPMAAQTWEVLSYGYKARFRDVCLMKPVVFLFFRRVVMQVWTVAKAALEERGTVPAPEPGIIGHIREHGTILFPEEYKAEVEGDPWKKVEEPKIDDEFIASLSAEFNNDASMFGNQADCCAMGFPGDLAQQQVNNWGMMGWGFGQRMY